MQNDEIVIGKLELHGPLQLPEYQISQIDFAGFGFQAKPVSALLRPAQAISAQCCVRPHLPVSGSTKAISPSCKVTSSLQLVLPSSSSIKALVSDQGVHLLVRDATLERVDVFQILNKIREVCVNARLHLLSVTLNGERIWLNQDIFSSFDNDFNTGQGIDRLY